MFVSDHATTWQKQKTRKLKGWDVIDKFAKDPNLSRVRATVLNTEHPVLQYGTVLFCALQPKYCQLLNSVCLHVFEWDSVTICGHALMCMYACLRVLCILSYMTAMTIALGPTTDYRWLWYTEVISHVCWTANGGIEGLLIWKQALNFDLCSGW